MKVIAGSVTVTAIRLTPVPAYPPSPPSPNATAVNRNLNCNHIQSLVCSYMAHTRLIKFHEFICQMEL